MGEGNGEKAKRTRNLGDLRWLYWHEGNGTAGWRDVAGPDFGGSSEAARAWLTEQLEVVGLDTWRRGGTKFRLVRVVNEYESAIETKRTVVLATTAPPAQVDLFADVAAEKDRIDAKAEQINTLNIEPGSNAIDLDRQAGLVDG